MPSVVAATLDTCISNAVLSQEMDDGVLNTQRGDLNKFTDVEEKNKGFASGHAAKRKAATVSSRKRKGSCYGEYYEDNADRIGSKVTISSEMLS